MLIIMGGLPGVGKTTISRRLADRIGAVHVRVDTIEHNIRETGLDAGPAGYVVAYAIAEDNLSLGHIVVADSVNSLQITRNAWLAVAARGGVPAVEIHVVCSDIVEHRRRVETRISDVAGLVKPDWPKVQSRLFEDWETRPLLVDTASRSTEEIIDSLVATVGLSERRSSAE